MNFLSKLWQLRQSILFHILLFVVIAAVVPLVASYWTLISDSKVLLRDHLLELNSTVAENAAQWVFQFNHELKNELLTLSDIQINPALNDSERAILTQHLVQRNENIDMIWVRRERSSLFNSVDRQPSAALKQMVRDNTIYNRVLARNIVIGTPFTVAQGSSSAVSSAEGRSRQAVTDTQGGNGEMVQKARVTLLDLAIPIIEDSQAVGALYAEINLTALREYFSQLINFRKGSEFFLVDNEGKVIAHLDDAIAASGRDFSDYEVVKKIKEMQQILKSDQKSLIRSESVQDPSGRIMLANIRLIDELDWGWDAGADSHFLWGIVAQEPKKYAFLPIFRMTEKMTRYGIYSILLAVALATFLAVRLSRPILRLTRGAERIAEGDYSVSVSVTTKNEIGVLTATFNEMTSQIRNYLEELKQKAQDIRDLFFSSMETIVAAIDARDPYTRGHSLRVTAYSMAIGRELGLDEENLEHLRIAGMLHDVGKIGIRDAVLLKKGKLTDEEFAVMKTHPVLGATIMEPIKMMDVIIPGMKHHHEWWDGSGYPDGLKGDEIPLYARIIAIADTFDAMTSTRPYQKKMDPDFVAKKIEQWAGTKYDPQAAAAFLNLYYEKRLPTFEDISPEVEEIMHSS